MNRIAHCPKCVRKDVQHSDNVFAVRSSNSKQWDSCSGRRGARLRRRACRGAARRQGNPALPDLAPFRTPYKYGKRVLENSGVPGSFDERSVDCPFVFSANGRFHMTYVGYDGTGYQTGLAQSADLVHWQREGLILARDPADPITRYNIALMCILRDDALDSNGGLTTVGGRYLGAWHAYPNAGYEQGPAVIGLASSDDLHHWQRTQPILRPEDGAAWERAVSQALPRQERRPLLSLL